MSVMTIIPQRGGHMEELLSGEVAKMLGVHPITVTRMAESGKLKYRLNQHGWKLFKTKDIKELLKDRQEQPVP